tara:strand:+ start:1365 stop:2684 length:1320 start_codon:yes stop_codon:yes gene_type:complete
MNDVQQIKLYNPSKPQLAANDVVYGKKPFITCLKYGRQTGKSYWALMDMLYRGMNTPNQKIRFITPAYSLATKHMQTIDSMFNGFEDVKDKIFKKIRYKEQEYTFYNGTVASFLSAESEDNLRGDTCHFMYIDEAAFMKETTYTEILLPMLTRTKGRVAMFSTPNGKNWFYDLFQKGLKEENHDLVHSLEATYLDLADQDDYEDILRVIMALKDTMSTNAFNREVMGEFISDKSLFAGVAEARKSQEWYDDYNKESVEYHNSVRIAPKKFMGIDIGVVNDFTVLTCIDINNVVVDIDRFNMSDEKYTHKEFKERIYKFYKKHEADLVSCYMEINNKELLYDELLDEYQMYKLNEVRTSAMNKPVMVDQLIKLFDEYAITIPFNEELEKELYAFSSIQNKVTGKWQYRGSEGIHDDMVMSLILAVVCKNEETTTGYTETY